MRYTSILLYEINFWLSVQVKYKSDSLSISVCVQRASLRTFHAYWPFHCDDHFANSRIGRNEVGRGREAIAKWPGKMRSAEETGVKGQLSPAKCKCVYCQRGKRLKNNGLVTAFVLKRNVHFPPHFRQVNSQLSHLSYLKYLQDFHISFVQTTLIFCTKSIMQACLERKGATKDFYVREVLCNPRKSVWAIDTFLCFLTTESVFRLLNCVISSKVFSFFEYHLWDNGITAESSRYELSEALLARF